MIYTKNTITWIVVIVVVIFIIYIYFRNSENFATNTEAIENIASLYNTGNLTATNFKATNEIRADGNIAGNNLYVGNTVYTGTTTNPWALQPWMNGTKSQLSIGTMLPSGAANPASVQIHSNGDITTAANISVNELYVKSITAYDNVTTAGGLNNATIIDAPTWDDREFIKSVTNAKLFTKDMQDGTKKEVIFMHPKRDAERVWIAFRQYYKIGKQIIGIRGIAAGANGDHDNSANPFVLSANWDYGRADII